MTFIERRRSPRRASTGEDAIVAVRVRPGIDAAVIDISASGIALETERRLPPGRHVHVQLAYRASGVTLRGRVVRTAVVRLSAGQLVYRCAVQFDRANAGAIEA
ncbi:MAG: PilZ domain-containing protein [Vicinamibacterales bacterium]